MTVIRAENGSGKTSTLQALRWALYGVKGLEDSSVRISPADWPEGEPCTISVEIDFSHTLISAVGNHAFTNEMQLMIKREVIERPTGDHPNREQESINLYQKKDIGSDPIAGAEARLTQILPSEMLDIFFTDGDSAMTFISPQLAETKVKEAIRSLLGLGLLERINRRIREGQSAVNRKISRQTKSGELADVSTRLQDAKDQHARVAESVDDLHHQIENLTRKLSTVHRDLQRALEAGTYEQLAHQRETFQKQLEVAKDDERHLKKRHQKLFEHELLSWGMLSPVFQRGYKLLHDLKTQGAIPRAAVPILRERLDLKQCICGTDLLEGSNARKHVLSLIDQQSEHDVQTEQLSSLYFQVRGELERWTSSASRWPELVANLERDRIATKDRIDAADRQVQSVEAKLDKINEEEIESKRQNEKSYQSSLQQKTLELSRREIELCELDEKIKQLTRSQTELRRADEKVADLNAELSVLQDLESIVDGTLTDMQDTYLQRVSNLMNESFMTMIGADPSQGAIYQGARITPGYSIVVDTKDNRTLNPDHEVNGASQRALTFAFIWALTEVSGVVAPRVIDTPLGMMSGRVKRRVLQMVSAPAVGENEIDRQVVLFLTQSEIANTEEILDDKIGMSVTLTKTDDYPADLVNDPHALQPEIRLCRCNHRQFCTACQRKNSDEFQLSYRTS